MQHRLVRLARVYLLAVCHGKLLKVFTVPVPYCMPQNSSGTLYGVYFELTAACVRSDEICRHLWFCGKPNAIPVSSKKYANHV
jgi:hypothetical protein